MTPTMVTPESQVFADRACEAVAVQAGGGPATAVAVMVTSLEGVKPLTAAALVEQAKIFRATYRKTQTGGMQKKTRR